MIDKKGMIKTTAKLICLNCRNEIKDGSCSNCGLQFEHAEMVYCNGNDHYCEECYEETEEEQISWISW